MGNITITIGTEVVTKDVDDVRLQRLCNLFSETLNYVEGATFANGGPPNNDKQKQKATLEGLRAHLVNWARERRRQQLAAEAQVTLDGEISASAVR